MTPVRRPLGAHVPGAAAAWLLRRVDEEAVRRDVAQFKALGREDIAESLAAAFLDLREAAKQHIEAQGSRASGTESGSSPLPRTDGDAPFEWVDCPGAAVALGVSERRVRQLLAGGQLAGRKTAGRWLADRDDVARMADDRRLNA